MWAGILVFVLMCQALPVRAHQTEAITVRLALNYEFALAQGARDELSSEVERIFRPGGIHFDWVEADPHVRIAIQNRPLNPVITGCSRNLHDHRLGLTRPASRAITLWTEQVQRAISGHWDRPPPKLARMPSHLMGRALGRVLAHELGHVFLRLHGHRQQGLMRRSFKLQELRSGGRRAFRLAARDLERMRREIEAWLKRDDEG